MGDNIIKLELTQNEVNQVLFALSDKPYKEVFELIGKIQKQGNEQIDT
jgi:predicted GTPase